MTRVLITGASGFLGAATTRAFADADFDVIATARTRRDDCTAFDLGDTPNICAFLDGVAPEVIVNCAVVANFSAETSPAQHRTNTLAVAVMSDWCQRRDAFFVQASGSIVHGIRTAEISSASPIHTDTPYGHEKYLAEEMIAASGAREARVRFGGIFGCPGPEHLGLNRAIAQAKAGDAPSIVGEGRARRNYIYVRDAANVLLHCAQAERTGVLYAGGGETLSIAEMMHALCDVFIPGATPTHAPGDEAGDQIIVNSPDLPRQRTFREALKEML